MAHENHSYRILIYCHDIFGIGHLSRCLTIAHGLADRFSNASVLILTGSPIIGRFPLHPRVDYVRVPGVVRPVGKDFIPLNLNLDIQEVFALRSAIIEHTADVFNPHLFLVDTKPTGLDGEILPTLAALKKKGCLLVLGLRDIMDDANALASEWKKLQVLPLLENVYDHIWVYGLLEFHNVLEGLKLSDVIIDKVAYTGYFRRERPPARNGQNQDFSLDSQEKPFVVASPGGGGDGEALVDWVIRAYETDRDLEIPMVLVFGPFMNPEIRSRFLDRIESLHRVRAITFDPDFTAILAEASGVVSMGGYNSFCEILSFGKKSLLVPRRPPKLEQQIRAIRAEKLGLAKVLLDDELRNPAAMAAAIRGLVSQEGPSGTPLEGMLGGMDKVNELVSELLGSRIEPHHG